MEIDFGDTGAFTNVASNGNLIVSGTTPAVGPVCVKRRRVDAPNVPAGPPRSHVVMIAVIVASRRGHSVSITRARVVRVLQAAPGLTMSNTF